MARQSPIPKHRQILEWQQDAACYGINNFLDEPKDGGWTDKQRLELCNGIKTLGRVQITPPCPVRAECLEYGLSFPKTDIAHRGIVYGGFTGQQLGKMKKGEAA